MVYNQSTFDFHSKIAIFDVFCTIFYQFFDILGLKYDKV